MHTLEELHNEKLEIIASSRQLVRPGLLQNGYRGDRKLGRTARHFATTSKPAKLVEELIVTPEHRRPGSGARRTAYSHNWLRNNSTKT